MWKIVKGVCTTALWVIFSLGWIPPQAFAQLLPSCIPGLTCPSPGTTPPPSAPKRYEESDAAVSLSPGWLKSNPNNEWFAWSGGTAVYSWVPGAQATFTFTGTSVTWIGYRGVDGGIARVFVDGAFVSDVDLFARSNEVSARAFSVIGLNNGSHTLTIEATGLKNPETQFNVDPQVIVVDAFDVPTPAVSHLQETDPDISYSTGWTWADISKPWSGASATLSTTAGAQATLTFNGTAVSWIGARAPDSGIARVFIDGSFAGDVDTYSPMLRIQDTLFKATGLADANHTLTIEATGLKNGASTGTLILLDAFDVTRPGSRFQETDSSVTYVGDWMHGNRNKTWDEGTVAESGTAGGAQATFTFSGTSVSWIGYRGSFGGIARVYLDGSFVAELDTYAPTEGFQNTVFTITGLANANHTLTIEATGQKNAAATKNYVMVDAFDVRP